MPFKDLAVTFGVYEPHDVAFLGSIYDDIVAQQLAPSDRTALAAELLYLFKNGVRERDQLYEAALLPIKDRPESHDLATTDWVVP